MRRVVRMRRGLILALVAVTAVVALIAGLMIRSWVTDRATTALCSTIRTQISRSLAAIDDPGTPGFSYYQTHPMERDAARRSSQTLLDELGRIPHCPILEEER